MFLKSFKDIEKQNVLVKQCFFVVVAKRTSMLEQNSKCLSSNACPFGRSLSISGEVEMMTCNQSLCIIQNLMGYSGKRILMPDDTRRRFCLTNWA